MFTIAGTHIDEPQMCVWRVYDVVYVDGSKVGNVWFFVS